MIAAIHHPDGSTDFVWTKELKGWVLYADASRSGLYRMITRAPAHHLRAEHGAGAEAPPTAREEHHPGGNTMNLEVIEMSQEKAQVAFERYRESVRARHDDDFEKIMKGYKALADGKQLISLARTLEMGGIDEDGRPRLACTRANAKWCWLQWWTGWSHNMDGWWFVDRPRSAHTFRWGAVPVPEDLLEHDRNACDQARAMVPIVPPQYHPHRGGLHLYHILWEAEWQQEPPVDPALLPPHWRRSLRGRGRVGAHRAREVCAVRASDPNLKGAHR